MKACVDAMEREQRAWQALHGRLPGMAGCSPEIWSEWVQATAELNAQLARYMQVKRVPLPALEQGHEEPAGTFGQVSVPSRGDGFRASPHTR